MRYFAIIPKVMNLFGLSTLLRPCLRFIHYILMSLIVANASRWHNTHFIVRLSTRIAFIRMRIRKRYKNEK
jgi:hypothetical protein